MTQAQVTEYLKKTEKITKAVTVSKKEARKFLAQAGICTTKGELKKEYR
jgi:hypothetical protein